MKWQMKKQIHIGTSPLTNNIYAGYVLKDGRTWSETNRTDVTQEAIGAVCEHAERFGEPIIVNCNGEPKYRLIVERLSGKDSSAWLCPRKCVDCEGVDHHWLPGFDEEWEEPVMKCKHCPTQRPLGDDENPDEPNFRRLSCMNQEDIGNG